MNKINKSIKNSYNDNNKILKDLKLLKSKINQNINDK